MIDGTKLVKKKALLSANISKLNLKQQQLILKIKPIKYLIK